MPRYYIHLHDEISTIDEEGSDLLNLDAACSEAIEGLRAITAQRILEGRLSTHCHMSITDDQGECLRIVTFTDAVRVMIWPIGVAGFQKQHLA